MNNVCSAGTPERITPVGVPGVFIKCVCEVLKVEVGERYDTQLSIDVAVSAEGPLAARGARSL